jgi:hypothetical protein
MKKLLLIASLFLATFVVVSFTTSDNTSIKTDLKENTELSDKTEYQEGWDDGHCEGWKDVKGKNAYCPYPPYPPYPTYPKKSTSYRDGYNDGFKRGMRDARKS